MTSSFGRLTLICNPRAGRGKVSRAIPRLRGALEERGLDHELLFTDGKGDASRLARDALERGSRLIVAVGGDGTVHEVVNGMIEGDRVVAEGAVLGVVAGGSGCDFIRTFGLPPDPREAVRYLDGDESFPIDVGKLTCVRDGGSISRYFVNIADVGLAAAAVARAERLPRWFGPMRYFFAFWLTVSRHRVAQVKVDLVDRTYEGYMNNMVVANGQFFGGGMKIAPKAAPTDGLLDIQIEHARRKEGIALLPKAFKGEHVPHPDIEEAKRVRVAIEADRPLQVEADGEVLGHTPASFELLPDAIRLKV